MQQQHRFFLCGLLVDFGQFGDFGVDLRSSQTRKTVFDRFVRFLDCSYAKIGAA